MTSLSHWLTLAKRFIMSRPVAVVASRLSCRLTSATSRFAKSLTSLSRSATERVSLSGREMSGTPRGVGVPVARRDEHGASAATSERSEDVRSIELLGRLRRPPLNGPSRAPLSRRRRLNKLIDHDSTHVPSFDHLYQPLHTRAIE